jgi:hypothetical protein
MKQWLFVTLLALAISAPCEDEIIDWEFTQCDQYGKRGGNLLISNLL